MLVKFQGVWRSHVIYVNPQAVKTVRPAVEIHGPAGQRKVFLVAGQTQIEYAVSAAEDECFYDTVIGALDEVAKRLNGEAANEPA